MYVITPPVQATALLLQHAYTHIQQLSCPAITFYILKGMVKKLGYYCFHCYFLHALFSCLASFLIFNL